MTLFEASRGRFGDYFGSIWGTFFGHFGGPERNSKKMQENAFRGISPESLFAKNGKKIDFWGPEKPRLFGPKMVPKRVPKKITSKT